MEIRKNRIFQEPQVLQLDGVKELPWAGLGLREFNEKWAYKPFTIYGYFNHAEEIRVEKIKEGKRFFDNR